MASAKRPLVVGLALLDIGGVELLTMFGSAPNRRSTEAGSDPNWTRMQVDRMDSLLRKNPYRARFSGSA